MPSCIRAPPEALKMMQGTPLVRASSIVRVIFSPAAWLVGQIAFSAVLFASLLKLFPAAAPMAVFRNPTVIRPASVGHMHG